MINKKIEHAVWMRMSDDDDTYYRSEPTKKTMDFVEAEMLPILREIIAKCRLRSNSASTLAAHSLAYDILQMLAPWDEVRAEEIDELSFRGSAENE